MTRFTLKVGFDYRLLVKISIFQKKICIRCNVPLISSECTLTFCLCAIKLVYFQYMSLLELNKKQSNEKINLNKTQHSQIPKFIFYVSQIIPASFSDFSCFKYCRCHLCVCLSLLFFEPHLFLKGITNGNRYVYVFLSLPPLSELHESSKEYREHGSIRRSIYLHLMLRFGIRQMSNVIQLLGTVLHGTYALPV